MKSWLLSLGKERKIVVDDEVGCSPKVAGIVSNSDNAGRRGSVYNIF